MPTIAPSYASGFSDKPLIGETIGRYFDGVCNTHRDSLAVISCQQDVRWTYGELQRHVDAFAAGLLAAGLAPGDRLGIWASNCVEWLVTQYAAAKAGLILVNLNPAYRKSELEFALNRVGCKALVLSARYRSTDNLELLRDIAPQLMNGVPGQLSADHLPALKLVITVGRESHPGCMRFEDVGAVSTGASLRLLEDVGSRVQFDDPVNIQFTSGTTGLPKGATLSHHNILNNAFFVGEAIKLQPREKLCAPVPLYHCFGMVMANLGCLTHAACVVYPAERFDAGLTLRAVAEERCAALYGVPTMFVGMLNHPDFGQRELSSLRTGIMAGSPCPVETMRQVIERMHMREVTIAYGMTETSPVSCQSSVEDPLERRVSTVGRVQPHLEVRIVDEQGRVVPRGTPGELCTRGYSVMLGYWDDAARTAEVVDAAGWMRTGDLATLDEAGYFNIVGRKKDMVIRGGENISPREVEEFLHRHPLIQDVQVIGVPDVKYGEELCAWIIPRAGKALDADAVRAFCAGEISAYKIPRYFKFVNAFPMTVTGKVQKFVMREAMARELGLTEAQTA
jgi:fatty-acyl-CoA synthase